MNLLFLILFLINFPFFIILLNLRLIVVRLCFLNKEHDNLVEVASAFAINSEDRIILAKNHTKIHHDRETLSKVASFLEKGKFVN